MSVDIEETQPGHQSRILSNRTQLVGTKKQPLELSLQFVETCSDVTSCHLIGATFCTTRYWLHYICIRSGSIGGCPLDGNKVMVSAILWLLSCASRIVCKVLTDKLLVSRLVLVVDVLVSRMLVADRVLASGQRGRQGTLASLHPLTLSVANSFSERRTWVQVTAVGIFINMILHCKTMY